MTSEMDKIAAVCAADDKKICTSKAGAYCVDDMTQCDSARMETTADNVGQYFMAADVSRKTQGEGVLRTGVSDEASSVPQPACAGSQCQFALGAGSQRAHPGLL